jgi:hypothetical protein
MARNTQVNQILLVILERFFLLCQRHSPQQSNPLYVSYCKNVLGQNATFLPCMAS